MRDMDSFCPESQAFCCLCLSAADTPRPGVLILMLPGRNAILESRLLYELSSPKARRIIMCPRSLRLFNSEVSKTRSRSNPSRRDSSNSLFVDMFLVCLRSTCSVVSKGPRLVTEGSLYSAYSAYLIRSRRADERTRTADLLITSELLYLLSYVGLFRAQSIP